jgi:hypothetical protein
MLALPPTRPEPGPGTELDVSCPALEQFTADVLPRNCGFGIGAMLRQPALGLCEDVRRHGQTSSILSDAIPNVLDELKALRDRELAEIDGGFRHGGNLGDQG